MVTKKRLKLKRLVVTLVVVMMVAGVFPMQMAFADETARKFHRLRQNDYKGH